MEKNPLLPSLFIFCSKVSLLFKCLPVSLLGSAHQDLFQSMEFLLAPEQVPVLKEMFGKIKLECCGRRGEKSRSGRKDSGETTERGKSRGKEDETEERNESLATRSSFCMKSDQ